MTNQEFSDEFDLLYNNITSNQAPGLDEYEKSVFLTKALDEIVKSYFDPRLNKTLQGFDDNQIRQIDFSMLIKLLESSSSSAALFDSHSNSKSVDIPSDALMIINEIAVVTRGTTSNVNLLVLPIQYNEYTRLMSKPFKRPLKWLAWRLINNSTSNKGDIIVGNNDILTKYKVRYIKRPKPIILLDLEGVSIDATTTSMQKLASTATYSSSVVYYIKDVDSYVQDTTVDSSNFNNKKASLYIKGTAGAGLAASSCELDPILHREILQRAVELAKAAWLGTLQDTVSIGNISATEKGIIPLSNNR